MLAYSDRTRSEVIPDVPTVAEQGYPDFEVVFSYVLMVPNGHAAGDRRHPAHRGDAGAHLARHPRPAQSVDTVPISLSTEVSREWLRASRQKWTDVIKKMNIRAE